MVKTFRNLLLWNQKADDIETWYAASSTTKFVQMMPLGWSWPILQQGKNLVPYAFVWEKS